MTEENWKLERDLCRCCLSEGTFKNLAEPCLNQGEEEIYSDMLIESLDVNLTPVAGPLCTSTYTICEECILRLRDACSFKRQVLLSEKRFRDLYSRDVIQLHTSGLGVKEEVPDSDNEDAVKMEIEDDDFRVGYDDDVEYDDNKSDIELDLATAKKAKPKKPKAKEKPKPKKRAGRPRKAKADTGADTGPEARADADRDGAGQDEKKDPPVPLEDLQDYTVLEEGGRRRYSCNKCGAALGSLHSLRAHIIAGHFRRTPFACPLCADTFKHKGTKTLHLAKKHGMEEVKSNGTTTLRAAAKCICDVCKKEFRSRALLARHAPTHRLYKCAECAGVFNKDDIAKHRFEAHGVSMPTCGVCGYRNSRECRVITHQRKVHLRERNLPCPECDQRFFDKVQLRKHLVRHNPVRIHECRFCTKKFPRLNALREHERIHTGDKRKQCPACGERFVQKASLNYHLAKRHPELS